MNMVKSLLLGSAAGFAALTGAQAADLPVKARPVEYVKICSLYGAGFYYIPGTDTCIRIGGHIRAEVSFNSRGTGLQHWKLTVPATIRGPAIGIFSSPVPACSPERRHPHADGFRHAAHLLGGTRSRSTGRPAWQPAAARRQSMRASSSGVASRSAAPARRTSTAPGSTPTSGVRTARSAGPIRPAAASLRLTPTSSATASLARCRWKTTRSASAASTTAPTL